MPIYEFYCARCHTIYKFFSRKVNTTTIPNCPSCKTSRLERRMSMFAISSGRHAEGDGEEGMPPIDESRLEKALEKLGREVENIDENDPRQAAQLMRQLSEATGLKMGPAMEEALRRMEQGEDPEAIEEEMGDLLEEEEPFLLENKPRYHSRKRPPRVDDTLYELEG
ncbi:MAG: zinc ribbon domain-containing protein [Calditrichaeota bacterium]|nr:MAG: zinc ribbon domain-containing protein [Calditrichota bacterium]